MRFHGSKTVSFVAAVCVVAGSQFAAAPSAVSDDAPGIFRMSDLQPRSQRSAAAPTIRAQSPDVQQTCFLTKKKSSDGGCGAGGCTSGCCAVDPGCAAPCGEGCNGCGEAAGRGKNNTLLGRMFGMSGRGGSRGSGGCKCGNPGCQCSGAGSNGGRGAKANGYASNGYTSNGYASNGYASNGYTSNGGWGGSGSGNDDWDDDDRDDDDWDDDDQDDDDWDDDCEDGRSSGRSGKTLFDALFGCLSPSGACHQGAPPIGKYSITYANNPSYADARDGQAWAAQGYGMPLTVPVAPVVRYSYNYSHGTPASRLTPTSTYNPATSPRRLFHQSW